MECSTHVIQSILSKLVFRSLVSSLIFYVHDLSNAESGVLVSPTIVLPFISLLGPINICFIYLGVLMWSAKLFAVLAERRERSRVLVRGGYMDQQVSQCYGRIT